MRTIASSRCQLTRWQTTVDIHATGPNDSNQFITDLTPAEAAALALQLLEYAFPTAVRTDNPHIPYRIYPEPTSKPWASMVEVITSDLQDDGYKPIKLVRAGMDTYLHDDGMQAACRYAAAILRGVDFAERAFAEATGEAEGRKS